ncbi:hypothetical protein EON81_25090 [bacterium]|nr:MAG: hypothetical protein EON81_25090 [bacterium]
MWALNDYLMKRPYALVAIVFPLCFVAVVLAKMAMGTWHRDGMAIALGGAAFMSASSLAGIHLGRRKKSREEA